jgi:hypothetical protein
VDAADDQNHLGLWAVDKVLEIVTNGLNAFPLFEVLLRIKEPSRIPRNVIANASDPKLMIRWSEFQSEAGKSR